MPLTDLMYRLEALRPESVFLALSLTAGLGLLAANPPFQAADEPEHYCRAFQISEGTWVGERIGNRSGGSLPVLATRVTATEEIAFHPDVKMTPAIWRRKLDPAWLDWRGAERTFFDFPHTVIYPPTNYLPQAAAMVAGRAASVGPLGLLYLARLSGFCLAVALGYAALRRLPIYRWSALTILACPMSLYLFGSAASDGVLIGAAFLLMALSAQLASGPAHGVSRGRRAAVLTLAAYLALAKIVYLIVSVVALLLVLPRLETRRQQVVFGLAWAAACLGLVALWGGAGAAVYVPGRQDIPIDPSAQWQHVSADPLGFLSLLWTSIRLQADAITDWFVGVLGWGDTRLPQWYYESFVWVVLACVVAETGTAHGLRRRDRLVMASAALAGVLAIVASQYFTHNAPGSRSLIEGVQGRYFLPIAPLAILSVPPLGRWRAPGLAAALAILLTVTGAGLALTAVVIRYY